MSDFTVGGADDFLKLSKALKHAARGELRKELNKGMRDGAKPLIPLVKAAARDQLPHGGGLNELVAREPMRVQTRTGRDPGVRVVVGKKRGGARATNRGVIRHPVFGNREQWAEQKVTDGWFDDTLKQHGKDVIPALEQAMERIVDKIVGDAKHG